ncbi:MULTISPECIES: hypothetical protein [unclassified Nodularia (in: cyanobacteria)]|nr:MULTISPECIES: hypothetical protein [unclassified Nodularia (in: cyanobacteria)]MBE9198333.1 hypothetical protein [Nodularia sp. LEGE 06071]MCC2693061.1 hypothetical protein [Nodularia sp. LEGE 04288]
MTNLDLTIEKLKDNSVTSVAIAHVRLEQKLATFSASMIAKCQMIGI